MEIKTIQEIASMGGKARWKGKTDKEKSEEMKRIASFRNKKELDK